MPTAYRRTRNRLARGVYLGTGAYFVTTSILGKRQPFVRPEIVESCLFTLSQRSQRHGFTVHVYCFMPDHLHLLLLGEEKSNLIAFMRDFKQATAFTCNALLSWRGPFWQKSYYDHVLRSPDDLPAIHRYILENPLRQGLADSPEAYPFSGSLDTDVAAD